jgi:hypothetical protein
MWPMLRQTVARGFATPLWTTRRHGGIRTQAHRETADIREHGGANGGRAMELVGPLILLTLLVPLVSLQVELIRARDPRAEFAHVGVVVVRTTAFDEMSGVIGRYLDSDIFASVVFRGIRYEYVGVRRHATWK